MVLIANPPLKIKDQTGKELPFSYFRETEGVSCREILLTKEKTPAALFNPF